MYVSLFPRTLGRSSIESWDDVSLKVFAPYYDWPVFQLNAPARPVAAADEIYWLAFCLTGKEGIKGLYPLNRYSGTRPDLESVC